ncbi:MAG: PD-(D/E)XK nuclease domain-containing protein [Psychrosphaera sp.]|nr:PD-(D/E)XK nuclease domain-containing protein [Psychrosphaera sp.]
MRYLRLLAKSLQADDLPTFFETLQVFFANVPYDITIKHEKYYQSLFYAVFTLLGFEIEAEVSTNKGRIDCVLHTANVIYVIEFKLTDSKENALKQIEDKQYAQKYQLSGKQVVKVGVEFDADNRNIGGYIEQRG